MPGAGTVKHNAYVAPQRGAPNKMATVMREYKQHKLHSGSSHGPLVRSERQAVAIGLSEQRRANGAYAQRKRYR